MTRRGRGSFGVVTGALGLFLAVFALLAIQMRGARPVAVAAAPEPAPAVRRVLERRVVIRKVIVVVRPAPSTDDGGQATIRVSAPVVTGAPAPAPAAPAPAAPAPAPAPLVTRTS